MGATQTIHAADLENGIALVEGAESVEGGSCILEVVADGYAKSFSEPFEFAPGESMLVGVIVVSGTALTGCAVDAAGRPIAGARFEAVGKWLYPFNPCHFIPEGWPSWTGYAEAETGLDGSFEVEHLGEGDYWLWISHPDHAPLVLEDLELASGSAHVRVPDAILARGCRLTGTARFDGNPMGNVRIQIRTPVSEYPQSPRMDEPTSPVWRSVPFYASTRSLDDGTWIIGSRIPAGTHEIWATRGAGNIGPFESMLDRRGSRRTIVIEPDQEQAETALEIPLRRW